MREIKFRAWHKYQEKMFTVIGLYPTLRKVQLEGFSNAIPLDCVELLQFTGVIDAKGQEIYEKDIVRCFRDGILLSQNMIVVFNREEYRLVPCWEYENYKKKENRFLLSPNVGIYRRGYWQHL